MSAAYFISGIQQVGVGTHDVGSSWRWYRDAFGMTIPLFHEQAAAQLMYPYTGGEVHNRETILSFNRYGGGGLETYQFLSRTPQSPYQSVIPGDYGIFATHIKCVDILPTFDKYYSRGYNLLQEPQEDPGGTLHFYVRDPMGNIFNIVHSDDWFIIPPERSERTGGVSGVMIGVSDIEQSLLFYRDLLGFSVKYDVTGIFDDFFGLPEQKDRYRRVMLQFRAKKGPFKAFLGTNNIELVCALDRPATSIYQGRLWGDPGFIHLCFDVVGMDALIKKLSVSGYAIDIDSNIGISSEHAIGRYMYVEDPDGTPIEFFETTRLPISKSFRINVNLFKRKRKDLPVPQVLLRMLYFQQQKDV